MQLDPARPKRYGWFTGSSAPASPSAFGVAAFLLAVFWAAVLFAAFFLPVRRRAASSDSSA